MPDERELQSVVEEAEQAARAGDFALADRRLREALGLQEALLGTDHPELASTLNNLAVVCETLGRHDDAERFYRRAYAIAAGALPPSDPLVVTSRDNLKDFCAARGLPLEEWPGIGEVDTPPPSARPAPERVAAGTPPVEAPAGPWPTGVIATVAALAAIGAFVVVTSWHGAAPAPAPSVAPTPPSAAPAPVAAADAARPQRDLVGVADGHPEAAAPTAPPAGAAPVVPAASAAERPSPPSTAPVTDVRLVVADVCASLSTSGAWRCERLGAAPTPGRAVFYTRIASPRPLRVEHRWYQGTALRQRVTLSVGASPAAGYRTFSRQTLTPGAWRVELRADDGTVLHATAFDVR